MVVTKCKILEINQIIVFMEQLFEEYLTYFQPTTTLHYPRLIDRWHEVQNMENEVSIIRAKTSLEDRRMRGWC